MTRRERELLEALEHAERVIEVQRAHIVAMEEDMRIVKHRRNLLDAHIPPGSSILLIPDVRP